MTNVKTTKRALISSVVALLVCFSMLIGTTFAWFTDSVTSAGNIIQSGNLDVSLEHADTVLGVDDAGWVDASTGAIFNYGKWEPGYTAVKYVKIQNEGSLDLRFILSIIPNNEAEEVNLADVIEVYMVDGAVAVDRDALTTDSAAYVGTLTSLMNENDGAAHGVLYADDADKAGNVYEIYTIALKMSTSAGNEYMGKSVGGGFSVQLLATQLTSEFDSFDDQYDKDADYDGEISNATSLAAAFANGGTYKMINDISVTESLNIPAGVTVNLDLNGKTITGTKGRDADNNRIHVIVNNGILTIKDGTVTSAGENGGSAIYNAAGATLTIGDVTVNGAPMVAPAWPSYGINNYGNMTVNGATVKSYHGAIATGGDGVTVINDANVDVGQGTETNQTSWVIYAYGNAEVTVNGGTFANTKNEYGQVYGGGYIDSETNGSVIINGGTFDKTEGDNNGTGFYYNNRNLVINGGTFDANPSAYVTDGYEVVDNGNGTWTVNNTFVNISNADGINDNWDQNILITDDFTVTSENRASANYGLWAYSGIDGNGNTITDNSGAAYAGIYSECTFIKNLTLDTNSLFGIFASAKTEPLVVNNFTINKSSNGAAFYVQNAPEGITLNDSTITASGVANNAGTANAVVFSTTNSKITINSGTYTATDANGYVVASFYSGSTVTINGGTFNGDLYPVDGGNIVINGGTFNGEFDVLGGNLIINGGTFSVDPSAYVTAGKTVTDNGNGTWTVA